MFPEVNLTYLVLCSRHVLPPSFNHTGWQEALASSLWDMVTSLAYLRVDDLQIGANVQINVDPLFLILT